MMRRGSRTQSTLFVALTALLVLALAPALSACDTGLQAQLDAKRAARYKAAAEALSAVEASRTQLLEEALPAIDAEVEGQKHPMVLWRAKITDRDDENALTKMAEDFKGTPTQPAAVLGSGFARESASFWRGDGSLERYVKFLAGYLAEAKKDAEAAKAAGNTEFVPRPFQAEAAFDTVFVHAARFYQLQSLPPDVQLTTAFPYWQLAFETPSHSNENFSDYVTRLCRASSVQERCKGVPHELRPAAINKPYIEWLDARTKEFAAAYDVKVFDEVAARYEKGLAAALEASPDLAEDPVLPETFSDSGATGGLTVTLSEKRGVYILDTQVQDSFSGSIPGGLGAALTAKIEELKGTPGNQIDYERVLLEAPATLSVSKVLQVVAALPRDVVRQFGMVGRRRADESLRRAGLVVRLPADDEGTSTSYQFNGADSVSCNYFGVAGKPPIGRKEPGSYLVIRGGRAKAAKLGRDEATRELSVSAELTLDVAATETAKIQEWADANEGIVRVFLDGGQAYTDLLATISGLLYKCHDIEVTVDERGDKKVSVRCGKATERDITLVVGVCQ
ncbi:MAG: hypothetical protein R3F39_00750 [Myxococcota bacterium]